MKDCLISNECLDRAAFKWEDLHGKELTITVGCSENYICVMGTTKDGHSYVLKLEEKLND